MGISHLGTLPGVGVFFSLLNAFILGGVIGFERQYRQRTAGLRTNVLVCIGAALFVNLASQLYGSSGAVRVISYVVSGIGFLGAGVIMREEGNVHGLNTAATLWGSAAVGACAGAGLILEAWLGMLFVLAANTLLRPVVNTLNRRPLNVEGVETVNTVFVVCQRQREIKILKTLKSGLSVLSYPVRSLNVRSFGTDEVEIEATLTATSVNTIELDGLVAQISGMSGVSRAHWHSSTSA